MGPKSAERMLIRPYKQIGAKRNKKSTQFFDEKEKKKKSKKVSCSTTGFQARHRR